MFLIYILKNEERAFLPLGYFICSPHNTVDKTQQSERMPGCKDASFPSFFFMFLVPKSFAALSAEEEITTFVRLNCGIGRIFLMFELDFRMCFSIKRRDNTI